MIIECYPMLKQIENRPAMYLGSSTLQSINIYLSGYYYALLEQKIIPQPSEIDPFFDWVATKLGYSESTAGWANMITAKSIGISPQEIFWEDFLALKLTPEQHLKSIRYFYLLLEEFIFDMNRNLHQL